MIDAGFDQRTLAIITYVERYWGYLDILYNKRPTPSPTWYRISDDDVHPNWGMTSLRTFNIISCIGRGCARL